MLTRLWSKHTRLRAQHICCRLQFTIEPHKRLFHATHAPRRKVDIARRRSEQNTQRGSYPFHRTTTATATAIKPPTLAKFKNVLTRRLDTLHNNMIMFARLRDQFGISESEYESACVDLVRQANGVQKVFMTSLSDLKDGYSKYGDDGLDDAIYTLLARTVFANKTPRFELDRLKRLSDFRYPYEWYPLARSMKRTIHLHVGPTNSGKTYHALQQLNDVQSGWYAGPLRLLAHEIYTRLNEQGISTNLVTGEDKQILHSYPRVISSTIEMFDFSRPVDVLVLDEIQMLADVERGWAWTSVLIGAAAKEVHCCGEESTVELVSKIVSDMGEELVIHKYERLNPLKVADESLDGDLKNIRPGDCVVSFSRSKIFALKRKIEEITGLRCATVYGRLPPEVRAEQARLFNSPESEFDVLVASDAIGMGLNLNINRIIFETLVKFDGTGILQVPVAQIKQIAGRAGRFKAQLSSPIAPHSDQPEAGLVTTMMKRDLPLLRSAMGKQIPQHTRAVIDIAGNRLEEFAQLLPPGTTFFEVLRTLRLVCRMSPHFKPPKDDARLTIAKMLEQFSTMTISDKIVISGLPISGNKATPQTVTLYKQLGRTLDSNTSLQYEELAGLELEALDVATALVQIPSTGEYEETVKTTKILEKLETQHRMTLMYLWLSFRYPVNFPSFETAHIAKVEVEDAIGTVLQYMKFQKKKQATTNIKSTQWKEETLESWSIPDKHAKRLDRIQY